MIETVTLRNYRGHTATTIPCGRLTVLVGENATGKTSVLRAVRWLWEGITPTLPAHLLRRGADELAVLVTGSGPEGGVRIEAKYAPREGPGDRKDLVYQVSGEVVTEDGAVGQRPHVALLALNAEMLAAPSVSNEVVPTLDPSGRGLASVLAHFKLADTHRFERIVDRLRAVVPLFRGIGFERLAASETVPRMIRVEDRQIELSDRVSVIREGLVLDFADADRVPASLVSEGTLLTLGVLTALEVFDRDHQPALTDRVVDRDRVVDSPVEVVLIDDVDRALHPRAQRQLVETLRAALDAIPSLQILATSHSPYLVDALRYEEVVVLGRNGRNEIVAKRLDAFPDERLRTMLSTGELWMSEGDDWVSR